MILIAVCLNILVIKQVYMENIIFSNFLKGFSNYESKLIIIFIYIDRINNLFYSKSIGHWTFSMICIYKSCD